MYEYELDWNKSVDTPFVYYELKFKNTGNVIVHVCYKEEIERVNRVDPNNTLLSQTVNSHNYDMYIQPGQEIDVDDSISWKSDFVVSSDKHFMPHFVFPDDANALLSLESDGDSATIHGNSLQSLNLSKTDSNSYLDVIRNFIEKMRSESLNFNDLISSIGKEYIYGNSEIYGTSYALISPFSNIELTIPHDILALPST